MIDLEKKTLRKVTFIVGGRGVVQLGSLVLGSTWLVPLKLRLISLLYLLKSSLVLKKEQALFLFSHC